MPLYVCEKCGCVDNTALGRYWGLTLTGFKDSSFNNMALCSECAPTEWSDGGKTNWGKWHGKFPKRHIKDYVANSGKIKDLMNPEIAKKFLESEEK